MQVVCGFCFNIFFVLCNLANRLFLFHFSFFYSGQKWQDKILVVRQKLKAKKASAMVLTALDEIACELTVCTIFRYPIGKRR